MKLNFDKARGEINRIGPLSVAMLVMLGQCAAIESEINDPPAISSSSEVGIGDESRNDRPVLDLRGVFNDKTVGEKRLSEMTEEQRICSLGGTMGEDNRFYSLDTETAEELIGQLEVVTDGYYGYNGLFVGAKVDDVPEAGSPDPFDIDEFGIQIGYKRGVVRDSTGTALPPEADIAYVEKYGNKRNRTGIEKQIFVFKEGQWATAGSVAAKDCQQNPKWTIRVVDKTDDSKAGDSHLDTLQRVAKELSDTTKYLPK